MSTWISEGPVAPRLWLAAPLILLLAGCFESAPLQRFSARDAVAGASVVTVAGGVAVAGPEGWCVDKTSTVEGAREAFVLLIRCRTGERRRPVLGATVTALPAAAADGDENLGALLRAIDSETGHGHLSRSGRAADVRIERTGIEAGAIWLRIHDAGSPEAFAPGYWRAVLPVAGRVVTLMVLEPRGAEAPGDEALALLRVFVTRMREVNGG
jgi:hypothetical protein